jgi:hypothetical protein
MPSKAILQVLKIVRLTSFRPVPFGSKKMPKGKLSLLGYESRILNAQVNGETLYRVRVGPYKQFEDMNKAKSRLSENRIEVTVIKIKPAN